MKTGSTSAGTAGTLATQGVPTPAQRCKFISTLPRECIGRVGSAWRAREREREEKLRD